MPVPRETVNRTIRIPGDVPTLADALDQSRDPTQRVDVMFESGYVITDKTTVDGRCFSHVTIRSADDVVPAKGDGDYFSFLVGTRGTFLPILDCLIDMQGSARGIKITEGSKAIILARGSHRTGIINAAERNAFVYRGSSLIAAGKREEGQRVELTGAGEYGLFVYRGSWASVTNADLSGAGLDGIRTMAGSHTAADEAIVRNCGGHAVTSIRSQVYFNDNSVAKGSGKEDLHVADGGYINAVGADFDTMNRWSWLSHWSTSDGQILT